MKPKLTLKCLNEKCENFEQSITSDEHLWDVGLYWCKSCHTPCSIQIEHGEERFTNVESFGRYLVGLIQEYIGLKKLIDRGVAENEERVRHDDIRALLAEVRCTCCFQPLLDENGVPSRMKSEKRAK